MKRIEWLDIAKYFFIMVVILEHLEAGADELSCLIVPYTLPGFLFVSGYTHKSGQPFKSFFIKKFRTLFLPWLILTFIDITLSQLVSFGEHRYFYELGWNLLQIRGLHDQMWFVAALFTCYFPFYFFIEWYKKKSSENNHRTEAFLALALLSLGAAVLYSLTMKPEWFPWGTISLPWHADYALRGLFFMSCGYFFHEKYEKYYERFNPYIRAIVFTLVYAAIVYAPYFVTIPNLIFSVTANLITPLLGMFAIFSISKVLPANPYIMYVGQNTLLYFAFHGKVFGLIEGIFRSFFAQPYYAILSNKITSIVFAIIFAVVVSLILIIPSYIVNRWFPFILGKRKPKAPKTT
ncbi:MAG: acyltransferase family protein [Oscillospiraceae bacterium]|nr:acyltransferase family protein [Oscillospiraceae bacterium]